MLDDSIRPFSIAMVDQSRNKTTTQKILGSEKALNRYQAKFIKPSRGIKDLFRPFLLRDGQHYIFKNPTLHTKTHYFLN